ncbi:Ig-like domain-containing protein [Zhihengliuella halotolerans]|uniref:Ig-like domain-containing protein n=1 Tax=Zhihengliuella halotolerans TaxID=370736 RepID=UPI000C804B51|nr:glycoside hydrolase [Zhihengliuella halotolerans]
MTSHRARAALAGLATLALAAGAPAALAAPTPAEPAAASSMITGTADTVLKPNPAYQGPEFRGWGTSLVWFANATGGYPEDVRRDLFDKVFGPEGLNLNLARYNIGGGNATDVPAYLRPGGAVEGWWNPDYAADDGVTAEYEDREAYAEAWDPDDPEAYNFDADESQRWWLDALAAERDDMVWEAFSNSPPYFLTESGFVSGGIDDGNTEQLAEEDINDFVGYLTEVVDHVEAEHGIDFATLDPFNEPNTDYWATRLGADGWPTTASRQEGAHIGPEVQERVIEALAERLDAPQTETDVAISAMDETNPSRFVTNWNAYGPAARDAVEQLNVHTYGTGDRVVVRDIAKTADKPLWMSEVEGSWDATGHNLTNIENGLGMAGRIVDDMRELEPEAWVFWQPVEDLYNMEKVENSNWGSVLVDFDCDENGDSARRIADGEADPSCAVLTNSKFNTVRNFTHFIEPGDRFVPAGDDNTTAALNASGDGVDLVHVNESDAAATVTVDLSAFGDVSDDANVTPVVTTESPAEDPTANALVEGEPVDAATGTATLTLPAKSVTTLQVSGVSGVAADAAPVVDGARYQLVGEASGKALTSGPDGASVATTIEPAARTRDEASAQTWTAVRLSDGHTNRERLALVDGHGRALGVADDGATRLVPLGGADPAETATDDESLQWIPTTTTGSDWSLVNVANARSLDVDGESSASGAAVGTWTATNRANQLWSVRSTELLGVEVSAVQTLPGAAADLPKTVIPRYAHGPGVPADVSWDVEKVDWGEEGTVTVTGTGTDIFGNSFDDAELTIAIGTFSAVDPVSVTTWAGVSARTVADKLPETVPAQVDRGAERFDTPVTWDDEALTDEVLASPGTVTVEGLAESNDPDAEPLPATATVIVTEPSTANVAPQATAAATFTEPGYYAADTVNGDTGDKAWSNWVSGAKNPQDVLTYDLAARTAVESVTVHFWRDGSHESWAESLRVEIRADGGDWTASPDIEVITDDGSAPVVAVETGGLAADQVRVVLDAQPGTHMVVAEVEIEAVTAGTSDVSTAGRLMLGGVDVAGFTPETTTYQIATGSRHGARGNKLPALSAAPTDQDAQVDVVQAELPGRTAFVTVTATDGSQTEYRVEFEIGNSGKYGRPGGN